MIELLQRVLHELWAPIRQLYSSSYSETYWPFLLSSLVLVALAYQRYHADGGVFSWTGFLRFLSPRRVIAHRSVRIDFKNMVLNHYYGAFVIFLAFSLFPSRFGAVVQRLLTNIVESNPGLPQPTATGHWVPEILFSISLFLAADFAFFAVHWLFHRVPVLWEFHKIHHSAERLNPLSAYRGHPLNLLSTAIVTILLTGLVHATFELIYPGGVRRIVVLGADVFILTCKFAGAFLRHSSVWLHFGRRLNHVLYSPAHHQIHHSEDPRHWGKNLGGVLAIFDWMAGTLYVPGEREKLSYGLASAEENERYNTSVGALYVLPFIRIWRDHLRPALVGRKSAQGGALASTSAKAPAS
jgi:sterol desaturase/sphingolipid hydroxylase (fatty acid hydroxylase superfamily)